MKNYNIITKMDVSRYISKHIEKLLLDSYSKGPITTHSFNDGANSKSFWSWPDCEAILAPMNAFQEETSLKEFVRQFRNREYGGFHIRDAKVVCPHKTPKHDTLPPHPSMELNVLMDYLWPSAQMDIENKDYYSTLWIDLGKEVKKIIGEQDEDGTFGAESDHESNWIEALRIPTQVGSSKCNLAILRSYLSDFEYGIKVRNFLEQYVRWEPHVCDGYFIIKGKMKRINVTDKLMMNMHYVVKVTTSLKFEGDVEVEEVHTEDKKTMIKTTRPSRDRICEVRSVRAEIGLAYMQLFLVPPSAKAPKVANREIFRFYNSIICAAIDKEFDKPVNIFELVAAYAVIVLHDKQDIWINTFFNLIRDYSHGDKEIMRICSLTRFAYKDKADIDLINEFRNQMIVRSVSIDEEASILQELATRMRKKVLPHCEIPDYESEDGISFIPADIVSTFESKLRFLAIMIIDLILSVTTKTGAVEYRKEPTDRKDFAYKRWEGAGHRVKDHIRSMFIFQNRNRTTQERSSLNIAQFQRSGVQNSLLEYMHRNQWPARFKLGGTWRQKKEDHKDGIVEDSPKYNATSLLDSVNTVKISARSGANAAPVRRVHTSQWGLQCPANTPENANIGLNNGMAEMCLITSELTWAEQLALENIIADIPSKDPNPSQPHLGGFLLIVDGSPYSYIDPSGYDTLLQARRRGKINRGIGLARHYLWSKELPPGVPVIIVRTSHGRPIFPVIIADTLIESLSITEQRRTASSEEPEEDDKSSNSLEDYLNMIRNLDSDTIFYNNENKDSIVEFIDSYEMMYNCTIALSPYHLMQTYKEIQWTHCMIKGNHMLSHATNCLSFLEHNPAARGTYGTMHMKQAIARPFLYPEHRFDHETNYLHNPELPFLMTDTLRRILYPPMPYRRDEIVPIRDIGYGSNLWIMCTPYFGNVDDGLFISWKLAQSGKLDGEHFNILTSNRNVIEGKEAAYDWILDEDMKDTITALSDKNIKYEQGVIDPNFSASVVVSYGAPYIILVNEDEHNEIISNGNRILNPILDYEKRKTLIGNGAYKAEDYLYELRPGEYYMRYGWYRTLIVSYKSPIKNIEPRIVIPGEEPIDIPGFITTEKVQGPYTYKYALVYVTNPRPGQYTAQRARPLTMTLNELKNIDSRLVIDTRYINIDIPVYSEVGDIYGQKVVEIPKTYNEDTGLFVHRGKPYALRSRRKIVRGDTAIRILVRDEHKEIVDIEKERFDITEGYIDGIERSNVGIKIRGSMPIGPKPGNKYASLYAQKSVIARIVPEEEMPIAKWYNPITKQNEQIIPDIIFNPLSFPSRMTIGMIYEITISGTIRYLYELPYNETYPTVRDLYETAHRDIQAKDEFNSYMSDEIKITPILEQWKIADGYTFITELTDTTCFMYDNPAKMQQCTILRKLLGLPEDSLYDVYLRNKNDTSIDEEDPYVQWTNKVEYPVFCGNVFDVALRHLVDNKRRARGYVGKRDPLTMQPVKGRRYDGGANTGNMEADAYKAHGAIAMLHERFNKVSDHKVLLKCPHCGGLVTKSEVGDGSYECMDCEEILQPNEVIEHDTVYSWFLFTQYTKALGIEITEHFRPIKEEKK